MLQSLKSSQPSGCCGLMPSQALHPIFYPASPKWDERKSIPAGSWRADCRVARQSLKSSQPPGCCGLMPLCALHSITPNASPPCGKLESGLPRCTAEPQILCEDWVMPSTCDWLQPPAPVRGEWLRPLGGWHLPACRYAPRLLRFDAFVRLALHRGCHDRDWGDKWKEAGQNHFWTTLFSEPAMGIEPTTFALRMRCSTD